MLSIDAAFANSLPKRICQKLRIGCSSSEGVWTLWTTTASDSSSASELAVSVVLCGTSGSTAPCLLKDEELDTAGEHERSFVEEEKQTTRRSAAALTKSFKPSMTDQFVVSDQSFVNY